MLPSPDRVSKNSADGVKWLTDHTGLRDDKATECLGAFRWSRVSALCSFVQSKASVPFGYIAAARPLVAVTTTNDIVFEAYCRVYQLTKQSGASEAACWDQLVDANWDVQAALRVLKPSAAVVGVAATSGPFLDSAFFVTNEILLRAPLFGQHSGDWLQRNKAALIARTKRWAATTGKIYAAAPLVLVPMTEKDQLNDIPRIIWMDCVRTFFHDDHRKRLGTFLHSMWKETGSYGQAMSYVAGILLLTLEEQDVIAIMRRVDKEFIKGHWAAEAVGFATNAYVWDFMLEDVDKELHGHFKAMNFMPDTYLQKIFNGLCIHVLDFDLMYDFLEKFFAEGFPWLLRFATALALHNKPKLMKYEAKDISHVYSLMRLDAGSVSREDAVAIMKKAVDMDMKVHLTKIDDWRMKAYNDKIEPRMAKAPKEETFEACVLCEVHRPTLMCDDCGAICQVCQDATCKAGTVKGLRGGLKHTKAHETSVW